MNLYDAFFSLFIIPSITLLGIYFSYKLRFIHILNLYKSFFFLKHSGGKGKGNDKENISSFTALLTILGGNLGTGNISGVAVSLATGGPGSLFWMSVMIFLTSIIKYASCLLGIRYRVKDKNGEYVGGPMYYLSKGVSSPKLASLFAILLILSALTVGNLVQVNSLTIPMINFNTPPIFYGLAISIIILFVTIGGITSFTTVITNVVPFMAIIYLCACMYIIATHYNDITPAVSLIFTSAFDIYPVSGGILGYSILHLFTGIKVGFARGIFATDIGLGLEAIVHSNIQEKNNEQFAIEQSKISVLSPFIVMIVCIITGLVLIVTGVWQNNTLESTNMCFAAFNIGIPYLNIAGYIMLIVLFCFAFTTILTWMFCANKAVEYLAPGNKTIMVIWKIFFILLLPVGSIMNVSILWRTADIFIALMLVLNLYALFMLSKDVIVTENKKAAIPA